MKSDAKHSFVRRIRGRCSHVDRRIRQSRKRSRCAIDLLTPAWVLVTVAAFCSGSTASATPVRATVPAHAAEARLPEHAVYRPVEIERTHRLSCGAKAGALRSTCYTASSRRPALPGGGRHHGVTPNYAEFGMEDEVYH